MSRRRHVRLAPLLALALASAACAPALQGTSGAPAATRPPVEVAELSPLERTAWEAWLLMEVGRLRTGAYSTQVLIDLELPQGVRWTVVEFDADAYALAVSNDDGGAQVRVSPDGVSGG